MRNIISASRRTDIPAFYPDWFVQRLKDGFVYVKNPFGGQVYKVSLRAEDVHSIVFWSKNYSPLLSRLEEIEDIIKNLFFHFTITGMPEDIEKNTPPLQEAIDDFIYLSKRYSPEHLIWRFDPVCITDKLSFRYFEETFSRIAEKLHGHCNKCYISFVQNYKKAVTNLEKYSDHRFMDIDTETQREYAGRMSVMAEKKGIILYACCNDYLLSDSVHKGSCINSRDLSPLFNDYSATSTAAPTRKECACTKSIDIGSYDTCPHGCLYCYANADKEKSKSVFKRMDPNWNALGFHVEDGIIVDKANQPSMI